MKGSFFKHFMIIGSGTVINMIISFISTPIITRLVPTDDYGVLSMFLLYSKIAMNLLILGLDSAFMRYYYNSDTLTYKKSLLAYCCFIPAIIGVLGSTVFIALVKAAVLPIEFSMVITVLLCIYTLLQIFSRFSLLLLRVEFDSKLYSLLNVLNKALYVALAVALIYIFKSNYAVILVGSTTAAMFITVVVGMLAKRSFWSVRSLKKTPDINTGELFRYAYPFIISTAIVLIFEAADKIAIKHFYTYSEVGIYASAVSITAVFAIIQSTFNTMWAPLSVEHYEKSPDDLDFYSRWFDKISAVMFLVGATLIFSKDIFALFLGEKYRAAAYILPFLTFHPIMYTISEVTSSGIILKKESKLNVLVSLFSCVANVIGNYLLVPELGGKGAAISTGLSYIIFFSMRTLLANRCLPIRYNLKKVYFLTALMIVFAAYNTFKTFDFVVILMYVAIVAVILAFYKKDLAQYIKMFMKNGRRIY